MELESMDALLAQNKAMAQQLSTVTKKLEKLEVAAMGAPAKANFICGICGGPHENHMCSLVRDDQP
ncbi:hypothetical protein PIB30_106204, partial [Stylosanthes scabra]|nr:hypothetical protein [Stylosanthes scabra]